jgi:hypothetical protein
VSEVSHQDLHLKFCCTLHIYRGGSIIKDVYFFNFPRSSEKRVENLVSFPIDYLEQSALLDTSEHVNVAKPGSPTV